MFIVIFGLGKLKFQLLTKIQSQCSFASTFIIYHSVSVSTTQLRTCLETKTFRWRQRNFRMENSTCNISFDLLHTFQSRKNSITFSIINNNEIILEDDDKGNNRRILLEQKERSFCCASKSFSAISDLWLYASMKINWQKIFFSFFRPKQQFSAIYSFIILRTRPKNLDGSKGRRQIYGGTCSYRNVI